MRLVTHYAAKSNQITYKYMHRISDTLSEVKNRIRAAASASGRNENEITLLGAAKKQPAEKIADAYASGISHIGENYLQEAIAKQEQLKELAITWHFIGPIQSNKTRALASHFAWVHSVDRFKIAERLSQHRPPGLNPLNICIQVNIDKEAAKSGADLADVDELLDKIKDLPNLYVRGLMIIPRPRETVAEQRDIFKSTSVLMMQLNQRHALNMDTLSMGMSNDLEAAIAEGATIVRIGTALFGKRQ